MSADNEYRQRFNREADIAATLWHPHIVGVHDRGDFDGQIWISMDYVDGTDAGRLLRERYPNGMPKAEVVDIVTAVAEALDYAHQRDLLHRDVKPANILLAHPGVGRSADPVGRLRHRPLGERHQRTDRHEHDGRHRVVCCARAADGWAARRAGGSIRVGGHRLSSVDRCPAVSEFQPGLVISQHLSASPPAIGAQRPELAALDPVLAKALAKDPTIVTSGAPTSPARSPTGSTRADQ